MNIETNEVSHFTHEEMRAIHMHNNAWRELPEDLQHDASKFCEYSDRSNIVCEKEEDAESIHELKLSKWVKKQRHNKRWRDVKKLIAK